VLANVTNSQIELDIIDTFFQSNFKDIWTETEAYKVFTFFFISDSCDLVFHLSWTMFELI
jgi:hypothetical protein